MDNKVFNALCKIQEDEINSYLIYKKLSEKVKDDSNKKILYNIAENEKEHWEKLKKYTNTNIKPNKIKVLFYTLLAQFLGLTFSLKLMENGEKKAEEIYKQIGGVIPEIEQFITDEETHEKELLNLINEEKLNYMGSVVLGLNDALVELTGALAGFTLAIQNSKLIAFLGLITGISASLSMSASEFLSQRQEDNGQDAVKSSIYTGTAYVITVILLVTPFFLFENYLINIALTMTIAILIILFFNFYISVAKELPFKSRFLEMLYISLGVASISFLIGYFVRVYFKLDI
ncbi:MAG TPA: VIT1/CCC1 transporter family protein [Melioribacteraceae bacterium]|nr:VIT1/CCC1 transporter family protein [Melioribacteraceae bacterium]